MADGKQIRVLLVDDEPLAREMIREMLVDDSEVEIIGECVNGQEALEAIRAQAPDLLFLDVQMPLMSGFELLEALASEKMPHVIFVTAYDQYAVRAFDVHAVDYLLKPFDSERFVTALTRAKEHIRERRKGELDQHILALLNELKAESKYLERLIVKNGGRVSFIDVDDIDWIEAEGNYVSIHIGKKSHLLRETFSRLEEQLDPKKFRRIHRSAIVRIDRIRELQLSFQGAHRVILQDGTQLALSSKHREKLQEVIGRFP